MVSSVRHQQITNPNNAIILYNSSLTLRQPLILEKGQDYAFVSLERTIQAAEIAANPGSLVDNADPTIGFLFALVKGSFIKKVVSVNLIKDVAAPATPTAANLFTTWGYSDGVAANYTKIGTRIANRGDTTKLGYSTEYSSLFLYDYGVNATRKAAAGDRIVVLLELGNS